ncbi:MAG: hypothetical protein IPJ65_35485 [Archangiaceae bacterium]|nr:hypothetical protein [Archangiaceae bacterium]
MIRDRLSHLSPRRAVASVTLAAVGVTSAATGVQVAGALNSSTPAPRPDHASVNLVIDDVRGMDSTFQVDGKIYRVNLGQATQETEARLEQMNVQHPSATDLGWLWNEEQKLSVGIEQGNATLPTLKGDAASALREDLGEAQLAFSKADVVIRAGTASDPAWSASARGEGLDAAIEAATAAKTPAESVEALKALLALRAELAADAGEMAKLPGQADLESQDIHASFSAGDRLRANGLWFGSSETMWLYETAQAQAGAAPAQAQAFAALVKKADGAIEQAIDHGLAEASPTWAKDSKALGEGSELSSLLRTEYLKEVKAGTAAGDITKKLEARYTNAEEYKLVHLEQSVTQLFSSGFKGGQLTAEGKAELKPVLDQAQAMAKKGAGYGEIQKMVVANLDESKAMRSSYVNRDLGDYFRSQYQDGRYSACWDYSTHNALGALGFDISPEDIAHEFGFSIDHGLPGGPALLRDKINQLAERRNLPIKATLVDTSNVEAMLPYLETSPGILNGGTAATGSGHFIALIDYDGQHVLSADPWDPDVSALGGRDWTVAQTQFLSTHGDHPTGLVVVQRIVDTGALARADGFIPAVG